MAKLAVTEKQVETSIIRWLEVNGYFAFKVENGGTFDQKRNTFRFNHRTRIRGIADIYLLYNGRSIWIEVKSEVGKQSIYQMAFEKLVKENGGYYFLARSIADVEGALLAIEGI